MVSSSDQSLRKPSFRSTHPRSHSLPAHTHCLSNDCCVRNVRSITFSYFISFLPLAHTKIQSHVAVRLVLCFGFHCLYPRVVYSMVVVVLLDFGRQNGVKTLPAIINKSLRNGSNHCLPIVTYGLNHL